MTARILVVGSLHHDIIVRAPRLPAIDETLAGDSVSYAFGGKGGNQAIACARHGAATAFAGCVGDDTAGRFMAAQLAAARVDTDALQTDPQHPTGMSVAIVDSAGDYGAVIVSSANLHIEPVAIPLGETVSLLLLQNEIPEAINVAVAERARAAGARVLLNAAPARTLSPRLLELVDILIVNRGEAQAMTDQAVVSAADAFQAAAALAGTKRIAIVTLGAEGAICAGDGDDAFRIDAVPVSVSSSHGAGDCFVGAFAARLVAGEPVNSALRYASAAAALHVSTPPEARDRIAVSDVSALMSG